MHDDASEGGCGLGYGSFGRQTMQKSLTGRDRNLRRWTASLLAKLAEMTDAEYEALDLYPDE